MSEPKASRTVKCTYVDCKLTFPSKAHMIQHKISDSAHDYCITCEQDFENEEEYFIHTISSDKHIACPTCYCEFNSKAGLNIHISRNHPFPQNIKCVCGKQFARAATVIFHIEYGECEILNASWLRVTRVAKLGLHNLLLKNGATPEHNRLIVNAAFYPQYSTDLQMGQLPIRERVANCPIEDDAVVKEPKGKEKAKPVAFDFAEHSWPRLDEKPEKAEQPKEKKRPTSFDLSKGSSFNKFSSKVPVLNMPDSTSGEPFVQTFNPRSFSTVVEAVRHFRPDWSPHTYFHKHGYYRCECGNIFHEIEDFEKHMLGHMLAGFDLFNCPSCKKDFRSVGALMAHVESMPAKCYLRSLGHYSQMVEALTAGLIKFGGYHPDGSGKFVAGNVELPKYAKTTIVEGKKVVQGK